MILTNKLKAAYKKYVGTKYIVIDEPEHREVEQRLKVGL